MRCLLFWGSLECVWSCFSMHFSTFVCLWCRELYVDGVPWPVGDALEAPLMTFGRMLIVFTTHLSLFTSLSSSEVGRSHIINALTKCRSPMACWEFYENISSKGAIKAGGESQLVLVALHFVLNTYLSKSWHLDLHRANVSFHCKFSCVALLKE